MKDFEMGKVNSFKLKCIALAFLAIAFIVAFIPLWQKGVENTFRQEMIASQVRLAELDSEERALKASAATYNEEQNLVIYSKADSSI